MGWEDMGGNEMSKASSAGAILLISDDCESAPVWAYALCRVGLDVTLAASVEEGLARCQEKPHRLVVIDLCGASADSIERVRRVCAENRDDNLVLLLVGHHDESLLLRAYRAGVAECIVKPISPALLLAKVRAWLRYTCRSAIESTENLRRGDLCLLQNEHALLLSDSSIVHLTELEFGVLRLLMCHPAQVLPSSLIVEHVWGYVGDSGVLLKNVIYRLRRKIEKDPSAPRYIRTIPNRGYMFVP